MQLRRIDGAALQRECLVDEHERNDARQQARGFDMDLIHGFSIRMPSAERDTHGLSLPVGRRLGSSLVAQRWKVSCPSCRHNRTVLMLLQRDNNSRRTSGRRLLALSTSSRASYCRTPTSLNISSNTRSGSDASGASGRVSKGRT
jgi:hypothetical protein